MPVLGASSGGGRASRSAGLLALTLAGGVAVGAPAASARAQPSSFARAFLRASQSAPACQTELNASGAGPQAVQYACDAGPGGYAVAGQARAADGVAAASGQASAASVRFSVVGQVLASAFWSDTLVVTGPGATAVDVQVRTQGRLTAAFTSGCGSAAFVRASTQLQSGIAQANYLTPFGQRVPAGCPANPANQVFAGDLDAFVDQRLLLRVPLVGGRAALSWGTSLGVDVGGGGTGVFGADLLLGARPELLVVRDALGRDITNQAAVAFVSGIAAPTQIVPEPRPVALLATGAVGLAGLVARRPARRRVVAWGGAGAPRA